VYEFPQCKKKVVNEAYSDEIVGLGFSGLPYNIGF
jgi:hypothetical protein